VGFPVHFRKTKKDKGLKDERSSGRNSAIMPNHREPGSRTGLEQPTSSRATVTGKKFASAGRKGKATKRKGGQLYLPGAHIEKVEISSLSRINENKAGWGGIGRGVIRGIIWSRKPLGGGINIVIGREKNGLFSGALGALLK